MGHKNRLAKESSPYLRQHEHNPVDWYPWGPEALAKAKAEDKPILLSIGYSACHWCHVMAHESFEDEATAAVMNELYVNVKVDREERPDLDQIYQLAVQIMGRSGGWPLTCFLTPDQKPFFAGTYFPPADKYGMPSFVKVLEAVHDAWKNKRGELLEQAKELTDAIVKIPAGEVERAELTPELLTHAAKPMLKRFDDKHGGFGQRPKFPNTMALDVLLRTGHEVQVKRALNGMRAGGIWDQLGSGFHRYSTDEKWLVPHFEKMLYDNALLARLYVDASRHYGDARYAEIAHDVLKYVAREMTAPNGAFFATQDADSVPVSHPKGKAEEGAFFVWTRSEVASALPADPEAVKVALLHFGVTEYGNFEDPHHQEVPGEEPRSVLHESKPIDEVASELGMSVEQAKSARDRAIRGMFRERQERPAPFRDEKVLASWNGLMIGACAEVAIATGDTAARAMAERALEAVVASHLRGDTLYRTGNIAGYLDDYAFLANAALDLYECCALNEHVALARTLVKSAIARFEDRSGGGFFFTPEDGEALITRAKDPYDHAIPSGGSMMALALLRLHSLDGDAHYETLARKTLEPIAGSAVNNPLGYGQTLIALDRLIRGSTDVVVAGPREDARTRALLDAVKRTYVPHRTLVLLDPDDATTREAAPALVDGKEMKGHPVAYVCRGRTCSPPIGDAAALAAAMRASG